MAPPVQCGVHCHVVEMPGDGDASGCCVCSLTMVECMMSHTVSACTRGGNGSNGVGEVSRHVVWSETYRQQLNVSVAHTSFRYVVENAGTSHSL